MDGRRPWAGALLALAAAGVLSGCAGANLPPSPRVGDPKSERLRADLAEWDRLARAAMSRQTIRLAPGRLEAVSYGEERPVDPGRGESAWARNRRVAFTVRGSTSVTRG